MSNTVGGSLIGNAWWSGVRVDALLAEAGVQGGADAVLQTSWDGWTCGTPLEKLTDPGTNAILAIAMNGEPLPIDHGFPVRMLVPGLYGYVSATKWVVDLEVTRFADFTAYWTDKGWSERGPVKLASRIEVPESGDNVPVGELTIAGAAWAQHDRDLGGGVLPRRRRLGACRPRPGAQRGHLEAVGGHGRRRGGRPPGAGAGDLRGRRGADRRRAGRASRRGDRVARGRVQRRLRIPAGERAATTIAG